MKPPPNAPRPLVIGLLGGIAAGKSKVAGIFADHGFRVLDADRLARDVVDEPAVQEQIRQRFGPGVFDPEGVLHRQRLAEVVFSDPDAKRNLEAMVHPRVRQVIRERLGDARDSRTNVVLDVPLLLEGGLIDECTHCVFLEADRSVREERAIARGWEPGELARRESNQASLDEKRDRCGFRVRTDTDLRETRAEVEAILSRL